MKELVAVPSDVKLSRHPALRDHRGAPIKTSLPVVCNASGWFQKSTSLWRTGITPDAPMPKKRQALTVMEHRE
jgi:hypothetical protein